MATKNKSKLTVEPGKQELFVEREFDAPREMVFRAFTDQKLVAKWLSPKRLKMRIDQFEAKNGGSWRYVHADDNGNEYAFRGVTHEVVAPERIIQTFQFEGLPGEGGVGDCALRRVAQQQNSSEKPDCFSICRGSRWHDCFGHGGRNERCL